MQEKDIREKLNQELEEMAPDILNKILSKPIEPVESEEELLGKNEPLFKKSKKIYAAIPVAFAALAACILMFVVLNTPSVTPKQTVSAMAYSVTLDVNPSITIDVNKKGIVTKVKADNKDAKKIVEKVDSKLTDKSTYEEVLEMTIKQLGKKGYVKKKKKAMLVSIVSKDSRFNKQQLKEVEKVVKNVKKDNDYKCKMVYQTCENSKKLEKIATKNNVTVGKAAFCQKISKKTHKKVDKLCEKSISSLIKEAKKVGTVDEISFEEDEEFIFEDEEETTFIEEVTTIIEETTVEETTVEGEPNAEETQLNNETEASVDGNQGNNQLLP